MSNEDNLVLFKNVRFSRRGREICSDLTLSVPKGKITVIMGPSGAGKSTLLGLICGQLKAERGVVNVFQNNVGLLSRKEVYQLRGRMGMMYQNNALFTNLTVFENVAFPLREHTNLPEDVIRCVVKMKLETVGLRGAIDLLPSELSGGMARRVALARAVVMDPELMMYDEPFTGLDPITMGVIVALIKHLNEALNMTTVVVSHDVAEAASIADYMYVLADGGVIGQGVPSEMMHSDEPQIKQFMQGLPDGVVPFHYPARDYAEDLLL